MKIMIIGATGNIGDATVKELEHDSDVIKVGYSEGDFTMDLADCASIKDIFAKVGKLDAIICAASRGVVFKPLSEMTVEDYQASVQQKLFGQIQVALEGMKVLNDKGSVTLTTGIMNRDFVKDGSAASMVNNGVEGFMRAAALDLPRGIRINVVSPAFLTESASLYTDYNQGFETVAAAKVARAYRKSVYGIQTGRVYDVGA